MRLQSLWVWISLNVTLCMLNFCWWSRLPINFLSLSPPFPISYHDFMILMKICFSKQVEKELLLSILFLIWLLNKPQKPMFWLKMCSLSDIFLCLFPFCLQSLVSTTILCISTFLDAKHTVFLAASILICWGTEGNWVRQRWRREADSSFRGVCSSGPYPAAAFMSHHHFQRSCASPLRTILVSSTLFSRRSFCKLVGICKQQRHL